MLSFRRPWNAVRSKCKDGSDIGRRQTYSTSNYVSFRQLSTWASCECQGTCSTAITTPLFCLYEEWEPIAVLKRGSSCCSGIPQAAIQSKCHPRYTQVLTTAVCRRWHRTQKNRRKRGEGHGLALVNWEIQPSNKAAGWEHFSIPLDTLQSWKLSVTGSQVEICTDGLL